MGFFAAYMKRKIKKSHIVASGGAIRKNNILRRVIEDKFGMAVSISSVKEEAANGAALYSAYTVGMVEYKNGFGDYIKYAKMEDTK